MDGDLITTQRENDEGDYANVADLLHDIEETLAGLSRISGERQKQEDHIYREVALRLGKIEDSLDSIANALHRIAEKL